MERDTNDAVGSLRRAMSVNLVAMFNSKVINIISLHTREKHHIFVNNK